jgi:hypothetical protein
MSFERCMEIFRAGKQTDSSGEEHEWSNQDLDTMVNNQDEPIPLVKGHPEVDDPAYGWAGTLRRQANTLLACQFSQVDPQFSDDVKNGRYPNRSVRIALTDNGYKVVHIGFLGAALPAVKGLKPVFNQEKFKKVFEYTLSGAPMSLDQNQLPTPPNQTCKAETTPEATFAEQIKQVEAKFFEKIQQQEKENAVLKAALFASERRVRQEEFKKLKDYLLKDDTGNCRLTPAQTDGIVEYMTALAYGEKKFSFTSNEQVKESSQLDFFMDFLKRLTPQLQLGKQDMEEANPTSDYASIAHKAADFIAAEKALGRMVTAEQAVRHIMGGKV